MVMAALVVGGVAGAAMSGGPDIPAPDPSVGRAQEKMADLATRQQDYYESTISPMLMDQVKQQTAITKATSDASIAQMGFQTGEAQKFSDRYWGTQVPLENTLINKALGYNQQSEQERMAQQAGADVEQAAQQGRTGTSQYLRARGIDLGSSAAVSAMTEMNTQAMLAKASAITKTRETARQMGWQKLGEATALGKGLTSFGQGSSQLALAAGGAANAAGAAGVGAANTLGASSNAQLGAQVGAYGTIGSLGNTSYGIQMSGAKIAAENDPMQSIYGAAAGYGLAGLGKQYSDARLKHSIVRIGKSARGHNWYSWEWNSGGYGEGVLAHEVQHIAGAVSADDAGFLMVDYAKV